MDIGSCFCNGKVPSHRTRTQMQRCPSKPPRSSGLKTLQPLGLRHGSRFLHSGRTDDFSKKQGAFAWKQMWGGWGHPSRRASPGRQPRSGRQFVCQRDPCGEWPLAVIGVLFRSVWMDIDGTGLDRFYCNCQGNRFLSCSSFTQKTSPGVDFRGVSAGI